MAEFKQFYEVESEEGLFGAGGFESVWHAQKFAEKTAPAGSNWRVVSEVGRKVYVVSGPKHGGTIPGKDALV